MDRGSNDRETLRGSLPPGFAIRRITPDDDDAMAAIIRDVMTEHGASGEGFAIHDPEVAAMSAAYRGGESGGARYFVVEHDGAVIGGAGFAPLAGGPPGVCELRKMYFRPAARGRGIGAALLARCLDEAAAAGFRSCYLETLESMGKARALYERFGFRRRSSPLGATGHFSCDSWYERDLSTPA
jgi:putative acetyltransferase